MAQFKIKDLPRKERSAHNMIRIPAWVFGGLWSFGGFIALLVLLLFNFIENIDPSEFEEITPIWDMMTSMIGWSVFLSLGLGIIYLVLGFTYRKFMDNGKAIMIGIALVTIFAFVLFSISAFDVMSGFYEFMNAEFASDPYFYDDFDPMIFTKFNQFGMIIGMGFSLVYYLVPALLGYIGFHKLNKIKQENL